MSRQLLSYEEARWLAAEMGNLGVTLQGEGRAADAAAPLAVACGASAAAIVLSAAVGASHSVRLVDALETIRNNPEFSLSSFCSAFHDVVGFSGKCGVHRISDDCDYGNHMRRTLIIIFTALLPEYVCALRPLCVYSHMPGHM